MANRMRVVIFLIFLMKSFAYSADVTEFYPPKFGTRIDFEGYRFGLRDDSGNFLGDRVATMKKTVAVVIEQRRPYVKYIPRTHKLYLAKLPQKNKLGEEKRKNDTDLIKYVQTLNDLRGFVKIRTETDALEYVRFGSSLFGMEIQNPWLEELFCVRRSDSAGIDDDVYWGTEAECAEFGFRLPEIEMIDERDMTISDEDKNLESDDKDYGGMIKERGDEGRKKDRKRWFRITRTVHYYRERVAFQRVTEEVGPAGQWRIIKKEPIVELNDRTGVFLH